jgi:hypothetical protein
MKTNTRALEITTDKSRLTNSCSEERPAEEVAAILDSIADFPADRELND